MIFEYIKNNYSYGEPIFIEDLPAKSVSYLRQELKSLTDMKKLARFSNGVYFLPYKTIVGTDGGIHFDKFINCKFLKNNTIGYFTGLSLLNKYGFTSQVPSILEIKTNVATTIQRKMEFNGNKYIIYKSKVLITKENVKELEFLELLSIIHKYSELSKQEVSARLKFIIKENQINFEIVKNYINYFPDVIFKNIYEGGIMYELL